jgi:Zn-dependent membrane protease YugP
MLIMILAMVLGGAAQLWVSSSFSKWSLVRASSGLTGERAARRMLDQAGLSHVQIERVAGRLSDHYDPRAKVLRLSPDVHDKPSVAAVSVACHEAGHAIQDATAYGPLVIRNAIVPVASFGSNLSLILIIIGVLLMSAAPLLGQGIAIIGVLLFATVVVFQIINLPVEFDASSRAKESIAAMQLVHSREEAQGVNRVLTAAAMTYVAATVIAILQLLYWLHRLGLLGGRR